MIDLFADFLNQLFEPANEFVAGMFNFVVKWCLENPFTGGAIGSIFGWLNMVTLYIQAIALGIVVVMRVVIGLKDGIFANGGDPTTGETTGQWLFKSLSSVALICAMPMLFKWVAGFSLSIGTDLNSLGQVSNFDTFIQDNIITSITSVISKPVGLLYAVIVTIVILYYVVVIVFQMLKRQIQIILLSIIAPLVAISSGTKNTSDITSLFKEAVSIGLVTGIQWLLLGTAIGSGALLANALKVGQTNIVAGLLFPLVFIALLGAIKKVPEWVEQYIPTVNINGNSGRILAAGSAYGARSVVPKIMGK
jgi:hypothetical protein